jgi:hypothetical protein
MKKQLGGMTNVHRWKLFSYSNIRANDNDYKTKRFCLQLAAALTDY